MKNADRRERLEFYANAKRASAGLIHQVEDGDFVAYWIPKLNGKYVALVSGGSKFKVRSDAVEEARKFRDLCRRDLSELERSTLSTASAH